MGPTVQEGGGEGALVSVLYWWRLFISSLLLLIPARWLVVLHSLAPYLVDACLVMNHFIGAHVASSPATSPLLKTTTVLLLITSVLLILLPLLGVLLLCLPFLWLCRLLCLPLIWGGAKVARLCYCYSGVPIFVALVCALGVVAASAYRLLLGLLGPRMPFELAAHLPQPVAPHFVLLPPRCPLFLVLFPLSIPTAHAGGLIGCLRGPVALPFLYLPLCGVLLRRILFAGLGTFCGLEVSSPIL